ncbi:MAG: DUF924 family protein [Thermoanaerobaculales bacterium]|jgi:uncharacterized protein (DUF924 family)|nr:DUF924 family protein [Thermoanaerobaculales bacterium]
METIREELLELWFGVEHDDAEAGKRQADLWWGQSAATDEMLTARFGQEAASAAGGVFDHWSGSPRGRLALILLLDQLPRVIHRGSPAAFAQDGRARQVAVKGLASGADRLLRPIERVFFYLPFEHSEDRDDQRRSVELFSALADEVPEGWRTTFEGYLDYAVRHRVIIDRFSRFPHRNAILGRESTAEEIEFLKDPGSGF